MKVFSESTLIPVSLTGVICVAIMNALLSYHNHEIKDSKDQIAKVYEWKLEDQAWKNETRAALINLNNEIKLIREKIDNDSRQNKDAR